MFELYPRTNELAREGNTFLQDFYHEILGRIKDLEEVANLVIEDGISTGMSGFLNSSYFSVEENDGERINPSI